MAASCILLALLSPNGGVKELAVGDAAHLEELEPADLLIRRSHCLASLLASQRKAEVSVRVHRGERVVEELWGENIWGMSKNGRSRSLY